MQNPFAVPARSESDARPLCPWQHGEHEHLYAPVDHTETAFMEFQRALREDPDLKSGGRMVLITGHEGCGKSALIHRAAWWARGNLGLPAPDVHIVDLMADRSAGEASEVRVEHVMRRMLDEARQLTVCSTEELEGLDKREDKLSLALPYLSSALSRHSVALLVLLPPIEVPDDIRRYARYARPNVFFFAESSYIARPEAGLTVGGKPIVHLEVDLLTEADGWTFVNNRLARATAAGIPAPTIEQATIAQFMRDRITGRGRTTIRELQRTCESVFSVAIKTQRPQVEYGDFTQYYIEKATLS
ncbi:hypothetical protein [Streptomyces odontomachi]|uniref:hypothetical protein n=1 Tax=Streptomyces odontomachi TaxID=2944940 RepID=UPI00210BCDF4|nr:hypothetical protein [Streptomyces sp. ODS25]